MPKNADISEAQLLQPVAQHNGLQPTQAVMLAVAVEIGVKAAEHGNAEAQRCPHRRQAERPLGCNVHRIRALPRPVLAQQPVGRQADVQPVVTGQGQGRNQGHWEARGAVGALATFLARAHQRHCVPALSQAVQQPGQGQRDAVDFGWVGFSHHTEMGFPGLDRECGVHR